MSQGLAVSHVLSASSITSCSKACCRAQGRRWAHAAAAGRRENVCQGIAVRELWAPGQGPTLTHTLPKNQQSGWLVAGHVLNVGACLPPQEASYAIRGRNDL